MGRSGSLRSSVQRSMYQRVSSAAGVSEDKHGECVRDSLYNRSVIHQMWVESMSAGGRDGMRGIADGQQLHVVNGEAGLQLVTSGIN